MDVEEEIVEEKNRGNTSIVLPLEVVNDLDNELTFAFALLIFIVIAEPRSNDTLERKKEEDR